MCSLSPQPPPAAVASDPPSVLQTLPPSSAPPPAAAGVPPPSQQVAPVVSFIARFPSLSVDSFNTDYINSYTALVAQNAGGELFQRQFCCAPPRKTGRVNLSATIVTAGTSPTVTITNVITYTLLLMGRRRLSGSVTGTAVSTTVTYGVNDAGAAQQFYQGLSSGNGKPAWLTAYYTGASEYAWNYAGLLAPPPTAVVSSPPSIAPLSPPASSCFGAGKNCANPADCCSQMCNPDDMMCL